MSITDWIVRRIRPAIDATEAEIQHLHNGLENLVMTMQSLEGIVSDISAKVDAVKKEVDDLIARIGTSSGGLTAAEASQLAVDLQAVSDKFAAIAPEPSA